MVFRSANLNFHSRYALGLLNALSAAALAGCGDKPPQRGASGNSGLYVFPICVLFVFPVLSTGSGSETRQAVGVAVFFGMLGVTVFGLIFTPIFCNLADASRRKAAAPAPRIAGNPGRFPAARPFDTIGLSEIYGQKQGYKISLLGTEKLGRTI